MFVSFKTLKGFSWSTPIFSNYSMTRLVYFGFWFWVFGTAAIYVAEVVLPSVRDQAASEGISACFRKCPIHEDSVCGSDGQTYRNECMLKRAACHFQTASIKLASRGSCSVPVRIGGRQADGSETLETTFSCQFDCSPENQVLCGENGKTYTSECEMRQDECAYNTIIGILHEGECEAGQVGTQVFLSEPTSQCPQECTTMKEPVCGSDGRTYKNICCMLAKNCKDGTRVTFVSYGKCNEGR